ncbi:hypothetical protein GTQ43_20855 [Nostoc sp. KVJ3]|uniref:Rho termination factor N-terminal domain-containing protein n=1 Tax=Nostoc sp. KVJ3 TaxID=457945 RepID=UPI0022380ADC|nr:Rho termination factor N-terminal domain-containing protein [Nostoc sp. KVJ3]MCW5315626.1 hypothetical protein [Nostoc sp. KVJ3]MCW5316175.1 hypothetical protein [Nostoc sp. KVJ3]
MKEEVNYPHIGQFHWQYFQQQGGKRNVAVSSTVPRVEMMLDSGMVKEFSDKKREHCYSVLFDSKYVFEYFYQKIVVNMGWENNGRIDIKVLRCFLDDFLLHCESKCSSREQQSIEAQALALSQQFPHKSFEQWKQELIGDIKQQWVGDFDEDNNREMSLGEQDIAADDTAIKLVSDEKEEDVANLGNRAEWLGEGIDDDADECEIFDGDNDIPSNEFWEQVNKGNKGEASISDRSIRELKKIATDLKIKGYSNMKKDELIAAIELNSNK